MAILFESEVDWNTCERARYAGGAHSDDALQNEVEHR
jgi:hypothetical protein